MALSEKLVTVVDPATKAAVEALAEQEDRSVGSIIRRALRAYLAEQRKEVAA